MPNGFDYLPNPQTPTVEIGHDVWIGEDALIKGGISIGHGAVVAAGAVVTRDVAPYSVVGGVPAKRIRWRFEGDLRTDLLASEWWRYAVHENPQLPWSHPSDLIGALARGCDTISVFLSDLGPLRSIVDEVG